MSKKFYDARTTSPEHSIIAYSNYASIQPTKKKKEKVFSNYSSRYSVAEFSFDTV